MFGIIFNGTRTHSKQIKACMSCRCKLSSAWLSGHFTSEKSKLARARCQQQLPTEMLTKMTFRTTQHFIAFYSATSTCKDCHKPAQALVTGGIYNAAVITGAPGVRQHQ